MGFREMLEHIMEINFNEMLRTTQKFFEQNFVIGFRKCLLGSILYD